MGTRERDQQAELERQRLEQELAEQQQRRASSPREQQSVGEDELSNNPVIINK
jgi:hypothetical protein